MEATEGCICGKLVFGRKEAALANTILADLNLELVFAMLNMFCALVLGAVIGSERQLRGRMAGLRTNALVALGAAGFVTFAALFPDDINPTRVAAQVVSGIGFLGAGIIFRDGFSIQGVNTAATLWCSAAVGLISGTGHLPYAAALTLLVVFTNLGLRPVVRRLKASMAQTPAKEPVYELRVSCLHVDEADMRAALVRSLAEQGLGLGQIAYRPEERAVEIIARVSGPEAVRKLEQAVAQVSLMPRLLAASWQIAEETDGG